VALRVAPLASYGRGARAAARRAHTIGTDLTLEASAGCGEGVAGDLFIYMDGLGVLAEIVKARKASRTVALERALACVFANMACQMFASCKTQLTRWKIGAKEALALLLLGGAL